MDNRIPAAILDTIDALYPTGKPRPLLTYKKRKLAGWHMIFTLQPGVIPSEILKKQEYFTSACRANVKIEYQYGFIHFSITEQKLEESYPYIWNPDIYPKKNLPLPVGMDAEGTIVFDLAESPHLLVAGVPGFGKSNALHVFIISLLLLPKPVFVCIIDPKRLEFAYLKDHCLLTQSELEARMLVKALNKETNRRIDKLESLGYVKIQDYHKAIDDAQNDMPFIVLFIDELAEFKDQQVIDGIDRIIRIARAVGISVVAATQRPSTKVVSGDTRAMFTARLCYQMADEITSRMVLGETCSDAAYLPTIKGRGIFKFGLDLKMVQTMHLPISKAKRILKESREVNFSGRWSDYEPPKRLSPR